MAHSVMYVMVVIVAYVGMHWISAPACPESGPLLKYYGQIS